MLTINKNTDQHTFLLLTFGLLDHLFYTPSFSFLSVGQFINEDRYKDLKSKLLKQSETSEELVSISFDHKNSLELIVIVDGLSKIFLSANPNIDGLKVLLAEAEKRPVVEIDESIDFYLKMSTKLFDSYKEQYKDNPEMLATLDKLTSWKTKV